MDIKAYLAEQHCPDAAKVECAHVHEVWEDGEITLTKCGSLYRLRNLHRLEWPLPKSLPIDVFPCQSGGHGYVIASCGDRAVAIRETIAAYLGVPLPV